MDNAPACGPAVDEGLRCLNCEYNLTGLTGDRCPECGSRIDWPAVRAAREGLDARPGTCWERWPWRYKPVAFLVTAFQAALMPWVLARQLRDRPPVLASLAFLGICLAGFAFSWKLLPHESTLGACLVGIACQIVLQTLWFWALLPVNSRRRSWRFWLAVTAFTSYPLVVEGAAGVAPPVIAWDGKEWLINVWPFPSLKSGGAWTSILFYLWWADLAVIAFSRVPRRWRWRAALALLAIPALVLLSSDAGCYAEGRLSGSW